MIDPTPKNQENVINSSVNSSATEGRRDYAIVKPPIKRKLILDMDDGHDEVTHGCKDSMQYLKKHSVSHDGVVAANNISVQEHMSDTNYSADHWVAQVVEEMKNCTDAERAAKELAHIIKERNAKEKGKGLLNELGDEVFYEHENHTPKYAAGGASNSSTNYAKVGLNSDSVTDDLAAGFEFIEKSEAESSIPGIGGSNAASLDVFQLPENFDSLYKTAIIDEIMNLGLSGQNSVDICCDDDAMLGLDGWIEINGIGTEDHLFQP